MDASAVAVVFAHLGSVDLLKALLRAGYTIDSRLGRRVTQGRTQLITFSNPLAQHSVFHAAAVAGQAHVVDFLHEEFPNAALRDELGWGITASELLYRPLIDPLPPTMPSPLAVPQVESGGWPTRRLVLPGFTSAPCNIDEIDGAAVEADVQSFITKYLLGARPVMIRRMGSKLQKEWTKEGLLAKYGKSRWDVSEIPYDANKYGSNASTVNNKPVMSLAEFVSQHIDRKPNIDEKIPSYIFAVNFRSRRGDHFQVARHLAGPREHGPGWASQAELNYDLGEKSGDAQFYLGPEGSGAPFHFHNTAWNQLVYGEKLWALLPPEAEPL